MGDWTPFGTLDFEALGGLDTAGVDTAGGLDTAGGVFKRPLGGYNDVSDGLVDCVIGADCLSKLVKIRKILKYRTFPLILVFGSSVAGFCW